MAITIHTVTPPVTGSSSCVISFIQSTPSTNVYVSVSISQSSTTYQAGDVIIVLLGCAYTSSTAPIPSGWTFLGGNNGNGTYGNMIAYGHVVTAADVTAGSITANLPIDWGSGYVSTTATTTSKDEATAVAIVFRSSFGMCQLVNASVRGTDQAGTPYTLAAFPNATNTTYQFVAGLIFNTTAEYSTTGTSGPWTNMSQYLTGTGYYPEVAVGYVGVLASGAQVSLNFGGAVSVDALFAVQEGATPSAPTLTSPANATYEDLSGASTYTWTYNNTDGSTQAAYAFRNKIAGGSTYSYYNASTNALQTSEVWNASTSGSATLGAGILSNGNQYNWSVATQSNYGLQGPFANDFTVVGQAAPTVTLAAPTGTITSNTAEVAWSPVFPSGAYQTAYQIWVYDLATTQATGFTVGQTTGLVWGSGLVSSNAVSALTGALPNSTTCVFYLQLTETGNELSAIVSTTATVNFTPPVAPTVVATPTTDANGTPIIEVTVTGHDNLLSANDASFEGGVGSWTARVNSTIAQSSAKALQGSYSLAVTSTAAGAFSVQAGTYPVTAGSSYSALLSSLAAAPPEVFSLNIDWLDVNSNVLSTSTGSSATDSTTAWTQVTVTGVAPTNAVSAKLWVYYGNSTASEVHYIDAVGLFEGVTTVGYEIVVGEDAPHAYWPLSDAAGQTSVADASGNNFAGTLTGSDITLGASGAIVQFPDETAVEFGGKNTDYINVPVGAMPAAPWSLEVIVDGITAANPDNWSWAFGYNPSSGWAVWAGFTGASGTPVLTLAGGPGNLFATSGTVYDGGKHHVVYTLDASGNYQIYLDGAQVLSGTATGYTAPSGGSLALGNRGTTNEAIKGKFSQAAIYSTVLSSARVAAHYAAINATATGATMLEKWTPGGFVGGTTTTVTRSDGFVLRTTPTLNSTTQQATLSDYEWTSGSSYTYTATVSYSYGTTSLTSGSATTSAVTQSTTGWWLINPITPTSAFAPFVKSFTMLQLEQGASHTQLGQALPTIVSSVMGGKDGQLTVQTSTAAEWTTLQNLINSRATLWLTNYLGDGLYVRVGPSPGGMSSGNGLSSKQAQLAPSLASNPVRTIQLSYQQVAQP